MFETLMPYHLNKIFKSAEIVYPMFWLEQMDLNAIEKRRKKSVECESCFNDQFLSLSAYKIITLAGPD